MLHVHVLAQARPTMPCIALVPYYNSFQEPEVNQLESVCGHLNYISLVSVLTITTHAIAGVLQRRGSGS